MVWRRAGDVGVANHPIGWPMTDLRTRIAAVAQHCREHRPEHECVCSMPPTDWDYELADAVIRELGLQDCGCKPVFPND